MAKRSPADSTIRAETIASVSGILMLKRVPWPEHRLDVDGPADLVDVGAHHVHADAAAGDAGHLLGGREAGREDEALDLRFRHLLDLRLGGEAARDRGGLDPLGAQAGAVVGDLDQDVPALVAGAEPDGALLGLAARTPGGRHLQAVIGGIADHVGQRILDQLEHLAVELGLGAVHLQLDRLAELGRQVAHDPRQLLPGDADLLHARLHDAFLQLGGDVREPLQRPLELGILVPAHDLEQLIAGEHQLGDHGHQMLERVDMHPDRLVGDLVVRAVVVGARQFRLGAEPESAGARRDRRRYCRRWARSGVIGRRIRRRPQGGLQLRMRDSAGRSRGRRASAARPARQPLPRRRAGPRPGAAG